MGSTSLNIPDSFETQRLIIRAPRPGDGTVANAAIRESVAELKPWFPWMAPVPTPEDTEAFYQDVAVKWAAGEDFGLVIVRKTDGEFVGSSGLHVRDWGVPYFEIGYWCRTGLTRQGYITEAVKGIAEFGFKHLSAQRLEIRCDARNTRSAAVAQRAGFTLEGRLRHFRRDVTGALHDMLYFSKLAGE